MKSKTTATAHGTSERINAIRDLLAETLEADNVLGPIYKAFGERLWPLMEELNLTLAV